MRRKRRSCNECRFDAQSFNRSIFGVNGAKISSKRLYFIDHGFVNVLGSYLAAESESNDIGNSVR